MRSLKSFPLPFYYNTLVTNGMEEIGRLSISGIRNNDFFGSQKGRCRVNGEYPLSLGIYIIPVYKKFRTFPVFLIWDVLSVGIYTKVWCLVCDVNHLFWVTLLTTFTTLFPDFMNVDRVPCNGQTPIVPKCFHRTAESLPGATHHLRQVLKRWAVNNYQLFIHPLPLGFCQIQQTSAHTAIDIKHDQTANLFGCFT
jgi:hypothetical protein